MSRTFSAVQVLGFPDYGVHECLRLAAVVGARDNSDSLWINLSSEDRLVAAFGELNGTRMFANTMRLHGAFLHSRDGSPSLCGEAVVNDWTASYPDKGTSIRFLPPILVEAESLEEAAYFLTFDLPEPSLRQPAPVAASRRVGEAAAEYSG